uniref:Uncharacterized protein n=1 Tax=Anguilla anguilla TaxID=7936 RepID=A0A0E9Q1V3_ANGAN
MFNMTLNVPFQFLHHHGIIYLFEDAIIYFYFFIFCYLPVD